MPPGMAALPAWRPAPRSTTRSGCGIVHDVRKLALLSLLLISSAYAAEKMTATQLTALAASNSPALREAISASFNAKDLRAGIAWSGHGSDFFFAAESA